MVDLRWPSKDPSDVLDYSLDWSPLLEEDETILGSAWSISPSGLTKNSDSISELATTIWLSSGTVDTKYTLTNTITTSEGRTMERSVLLYVINK